MRSKRCNRRSRVASAEAAAGVTREAGITRPEVVIREADHTREAGEWGAVAWVAASLCSLPSGSV